MVWMADAAGRCFYFNRQWLEFRGRSEDQESGDGWAEGVHPEDRERILAALAEALRERRGFDTEYRLRRHDGEYRWILHRGAPRFDDRAEFAGHAGSAIDITGRRREEELLRQSQDKLKAFFESASQGILTVGGEGRIHMANRAASELFGYRREELEGLRLEALIPERFRQGHGAHQRNFFANLRKRPMGAGLDLRARRKDGSEFPVEIGLSFVHTLDGPEVIALITDISERKRIQEMLQRSNEELRYFLNAASHDLQEPLRTIRTYAELLVRSWPENVDPDQTEFVQYIAKGVERLQSLIQALLSYQRAGIASEVLEPREGGDELEAALNGLQALIAQTGATVESEPLPRVLTGEPGLAHVLQNLIGNAIKYRGREAPRIAIRAEREGGFWRFVVSDNGAGIAPEHLEAVFKPFRRLHSQEIPGSGMGLAICRKIVERQGGRMWLESEPGRGSTFYFTMRAAAPDSER